MCSLTYPEVQRLSELQLLLVEKANEISYIKKMMAELTSDHCTIEISFKLHNETVCEAEKALASVAVLLNGPRMQGPQRFSKNAKCVKQVSHLFSESSGLRMLHVVLQEKEIQKQELHAEAESLLHKLHFSTTQIYSHERI